ncbi:MAG: aminomethyl-transferring glycine dehydrogenase subunit GcvPB, partial [Anaerolineae bacterium]
MAGRNRVSRSLIGMGYSDCVTPPPILRNVLENPGWYTAYTPYQPEIAQGRLEALINYQTMIADLTGLDIANASLLDEATAAAEAMAMCFAVKGRPDRNLFFVADDCHPQTIEVVRTRADGRGIEVAVGDHRALDPGPELFGVLVQYPATDGVVHDYRELTERVHEAGGLVAVAADILGLALLTPPGDWGADIAIGNSGRFGVPMGYGGPHAAFFATRDEHKRRMPGRIVGVSRDAAGDVAFRLSLQTREQHIRREKATSNICTAQVLLAVIAGMYAVYHGADGLRRIAADVHAKARALAGSLRAAGFEPFSAAFFDTITVSCGRLGSDAVLAAAEDAGINLRRLDGERVGIALDERTSWADVGDIAAVFAAAAGAAEGATARGDAKGGVDDATAPGGDAPAASSASILGEAADYAVAAVEDLPDWAVRRTDFMTHPVFSAYQSETELMRYLKRLESRDLSLTTSMIPLGSCTMKLNAAAEMLPITWPEFAALHPFAPVEQAEGYTQLLGELGSWLAEITGFAAASFQPNAGSQGEYTGLKIIRRYHELRGEGGRDVCLIPASAHGTNPASAIMAGLDVVVVATDGEGNIDLADLRAKAEEHSRRLAALMVTYPSTHGIFEASIRDVCAIVHEHGGQVYLDGANLNAMVGLCRPGEFGADVCHLNLHKTFCIPHGGGGPGMGPVCVADHLADYLPGHPVVATGGDQAMGPVSAAPFGSPSILPISWAYIRMLGADGLRRATEVAILNANYCARRLEEHYPVLYKGKNGTVAHECIIDPRPLKGTSGVSETDIAKRLMDYGFHAPTVSFPVPGTLMIEPTESESKEELDRFCDALIAIREEIRRIQDGDSDPDDNALKGAPHTAAAVTADDWSRAYGRERAAYPAPWCKAHKFWPAVGRIDEPYGDRHLMCSCPPLDAYE